MNLKYLKGVNLGGWLLLEKWITPSLFLGYDADDEYSFSAVDALSREGRLDNHRNTFIKKTDIFWLKEHGYNAVRLPVGYWATQDDPPYVNCLKYIDRAFSWSEAAGLKVLLDLHGAAGSQNGLDHSGRKGSVRWSQPQNLRRTLRALEELADRYSKSPALWGISLVNEPAAKLTLKSIRRFYRQAYGIVRNHVSEDVAIVISDAFKPSSWDKFMVSPDYEFVVLDMHLYQCFSGKDKAMDIEQHIKKAEDEWKRLINERAREVIVGEWSLGLEPSTFEGMGPQKIRASLKSYASAQQDAFKAGRGDFFWNYKTEASSSWNLRYLVEAGILVPQ